MELTEEEVADIITYQIGALKGFCDLEGVPLNHVKVSKFMPHERACRTCIAAQRITLELILTFVVRTLCSRTELSTFT